MKALSLEEIEEFARLPNVACAIKELNKYRVLGEQLIHTAREYHSLKKALIHIAAFDEGDEVNSTFDCPVHAKEAREALKE